MIKFKAENDLSPLLLPSGQSRFFLFLVLVSWNREGKKKKKKAELGLGWHKEALSVQNVSSRSALAWTWAWAPSQIVSWVLYLSYPSLGPKEKSDSKVLLGLLILGTEVWHLPSASTWSKTWATAAANPQHPMSRAQAGDQQWGPLCSGKTGRTGLQIGRYF